MNLTIGIVLYNEEKHVSLLEKNLQHLKSHSDVQVIIIDNGSTDRTSELLSKLQSRYPFELITRASKCLGPARGEIVRRARSEWVAFIDGDCEINSQWLPEFFKINQGLHNKIAAIGGPLHPGGALRPVYQSLFKSFLGHFNSTQAKVFNQTHQVDHIPTANVFYRRQILLEVGHFSDDFATVGEDLDLSYRLAKNNYELWIYPQLAITHYLPESAYGWFLKVFKYGWGRALVGAQHRDLLSLRYILPLLFAPSLIVGLVTPIQVFSYLWIIYFSMILVLSVINRSKELWYYLFLTHLGYSLGLTSGLVLILALKICRTTFRLSKKWRPVEQK